MRRQAYMQGGMHSGEVHKPQMSNAMSQDRAAWRNSGSLGFRV